MSCDDAACAVEFANDKYEITFGVAPERLQATRAALNSPRPNITVVVSQLDAIRIAQAILEGIAIDSINRSEWCRCAQRGVN